MTKSSLILYDDWNSTSKWTKKYWGKKIFFYMQIKADMMADNSKRIKKGGRGKQKFQQSKN